ncbi:MAG TPA: tol-pal system protein YbgF [Casimicrobiaceae bacterium]
MRARSIVAAIALFAITAGSANAALFPDDEARQQISDTNRRLSDLQQQIDSRLTAIEQQLKGGGIADLANQMQLLQADLAKLRGQIEVVNYELDQAQKRQRDLYIDLDTRLRKLESAAATNSAAPGEGAGGALGASPGAVAPGVPGAPGTSAGMPPATPAVGAAAPGTAAGATPGVSPGAAPPHPPGPVASPPVVANAAPTRSAANTADEQRAYDSALDKFKRGEYQAAITAFGSFVKTWPHSTLAPSAQYWLGNAQYARRDYRASINTQRRLLLNWPQSSKAPEALLNIASAQSDMGDNKAARKSLEELIHKYPKSDAAAKARERLGVR